MENAASTIQSIANNRDIDNTSNSQTKNNNENEVESSVGVVQKEKENGSTNKENKSNDEQFINKESDNNNEIIKEINTKSNDAAALAINKEGNEDDRDELIRQLRDQITQDRIKHNLILYDSNLLKIRNSALEEVVDNYPPYLLERVEVIKQQTDNCRLQRDHDNLRLEQGEAERVSLKKTNKTLAKENSKLKKMNRNMAKIVKDKGRFPMKTTISQILLNFYILWCTIS